jgi:hypothetical protein
MKLLNQIISQFSFSRSALFVLISLFIFTISLNAKDLETIKAELDLATSEINYLRKSNEQLKAKIAEQQKELLLLRTQKEKAAQELRNIKLFMGNVVESGSFKDAKTKEEQLLRLILEMSTRGNKLALLSEEFTSNIKNLLPTLPLGQAQVARLLLKIDELNYAARNFAGMGSAAKDKDFRILAINNNLDIVVISAGSINGFAPGMNLMVKNYDIQLKLIAVRPQISAAIVAKGNIKNLTPGMRVVENFRRKKNINLNVFRQ